MEEFNKQPQGKKGMNDVSRECEYNSPRYNVPGKEFNTASKYSAAKASRKKNFLRSHILSLSTAMIAVVTVASGSLFPSSSPKAYILDVYEMNTEIIWYVDVENADDSLKIVLYNDFTYREASLSEGIREGIFSDLQENMQYKLVIYGKSMLGNKILSERKVQTKTFEDEHVPF